MAEKGLIGVSLLSVMVLFAGAMLMAVVMLGLQQYFWTRRRFTELRLDAIHDLNWLLAQFLTNCMADPAYTPGDQFLHSWNAAVAKARGLFPERALERLEHLHVHIAPSSADPAPTTQPDVRQLTQLHDAALRALYREAGFRGSR